MSIIAAALLICVIALGISAGKKSVEDTANVISAEQTTAEITTEETATAETTTPETEQSSEEPTVGFELEYQADNGIYNVGGLVGWESGNNDSVNVIRAWTNTIKQLDLDVDIAFFGDSIFQRGDFREYFPDKKLINLGCGGDTIRGVYNRAEVLSYVNAEKIFIMCGVNMLRNDNVDFCTAEYGGLLNAVSEYAPESEIYACSILPMRQDWQDEYCSKETTESFNVIIKELAESRGMTYVDLYPLFENEGTIVPGYTVDGVHLTTQGYDVFAEGISQYIYG